jgi:hypothetical protein
MAQPFTMPSDDAESFNCPLCHAYAHQEWFELHRQEPIMGGRITGFATVEGLKSSKCGHCKKFLYWHEGKIVFPDVSDAPPANDDLAGDIKADYAEASSIAAKSPRGAAALLRLCIQKLCRQLGEPGKNINDDIASLVSKGLDVHTQQALDTVRVIGNEAVHPGEMDLKDDLVIAGALFGLVNSIANDMITQPRLRKELYAKLPASKLAGIADRDAKAKPVS